MERKWVNLAFLLWYIFAYRKSMCMGSLSDIPRKGVRNKWKSAQKYHKEKQRKEKYKTEEKKHMSNKHFLTSVFALISGSCPPFQTAAFIKLWKHIAQSFTSKINILGQFTILCHCVFRAVFTFLLGNIFYSDIWKHQP